MDLLDPTPSPAGTALRVCNRTFDELAVGDRAQLARTLSRQDIELFAVLSGDINPQHLDAEFAASTRFHGVVAHGMWGGALISAVLGTHLPGPGTVYLGRTLRFLAPVHVGDTLTVEVRVSAREEVNRHVMLDCRCTRQDGVVAIEGEATVLAPRQKVERLAPALPVVRLVHGG